VVPALIALAVVVLLGLAVAGMYNRLVALRNRASVTFVRT
jgi:hypothetical protein